MNPLNYLRLWLNGDGPLSDNGAGTVGYFRTEKADPTDKRPDIQILTMAFGFNLDYGLGLRHAYNLADESFASMFEGHETDSVFVVAPTLSRPKSRGTLHLASTDVHDAPVIDPNYLSNKDDVETLKAAYKHVMKIKDTKAFKVSDCIKSYPQW
jgi:choline dehydrogenase-like flavoprotein